MPNQQHSTPDESQTTELLESIVTALNRGQLNPPAVAHTVRSTHAYLQQQLFDQVLKPALIGLADSHSDARNEQAVSEAEAIVDNRNWTKRIDDK